jgi:hypothetical protein
MLLRILAFFVLLFSILFMPLWVSIVLALSGMIYFNVFWEAVLLFLLSDLLYGVREAKLSGMIFISFAVSVLVLIIIEIVKKKLKFYPSTTLN